MNIVPKSGGNSFAGTAFLNTAGNWSSGNNLTDDLQALNPNLKQTPGIIKRLRRERRRSAARS